MTVEKGAPNEAGARPERKRGRQSAAVVGSLLAHLLVLTLAAIGLGKPSLFLPDAALPAPFVVDLVAPPPAIGVQPSAAGPSATGAGLANQAADPAVVTPVAPSPAPPTEVKARAPRLPPLDVETAAVSVSNSGAADGAAMILGEAQLAGATVAGSGGGQGSGSGGAGAGGVCDMAGRVQTALRANVEARRAIAEAYDALAAGRGALLMWNGDWVQALGQAGKGLAGVRQAIALEVAFAPPACRTQAVRGLVLLSLGEGPEGARLALGRTAWKWSDLLGL